MMSSLSCLVFLVNSHKFGVMRSKERETLTLFLWYALKQLGRQWLFAVALCVVKSLFVHLVIINLATKHAKVTSVQKGHLRYECKKLSPNGFTHFLYIKLPFT